MSAVVIESCIAEKWVELGLHIATAYECLMHKALEQISGTLKRGSKLIVTSF